MGSGLILQSIKTAPVNMRVYWCARSHILIPDGRQVAHYYLRRENRRAHMCSCEHALMAETSSVTMKDIDLIVPSKTLVIDLVMPPCAESRPSTSSQALWQRALSQSFHALPRSQRTKLLPQFTIHTWRIGEDSEKMQDSDAGSSVGSATAAGNIESSLISPERIGTCCAGTA